MTRRRRRRRDKDEEKDARSCVPPPWKIGKIQIQLSFDRATGARSPWLLSNVWVRRTWLPACHLEEEKKGTRRGRGGARSWRRRMRRRPRRKWRWKWERSRRWKRLRQTLDIILDLTQPHRPFES